MRSPIKGPKCFRTTDVVSVVRVFYDHYCRSSVRRLRPAGVDSLSLFENTSTELGGGAAALLEFLQTFPRILSKQETLQRVKEATLHELLFLLWAGLGLQTEDPRHLLLQVAEQLCPGVCSLEPFLQNRAETTCTVDCLIFRFVAHTAYFNRKKE